MTTAEQVIDQCVTLLEGSCRPGFKMLAGKCVRMSRQEIMNRSKAAKNRKRKGGVKASSVIDTNKNKKSIKKGRVKAAVGAGGLVATGAAVGGATGGPAGAAVGAATGAALAGTSYATAKRHHKKVANVQKQIDDKNK